MEVHTATRKDHRCSECGRRIPIGAKYFSENGGESREHTNCLLFEHEALLPSDYNQNRKLKKKSNSQAVE